MKRVDYFSLIDFMNSPGVANKLVNTVEAFNKSGYDANSYFFPLSVKGGLKMLVAASKSKADFIIIRYSLIFAPLLFFVICYLRMSGKKVVVDVPTPRTVVAKETLHAKKKSILNIFKFVVLILSGSWVLWPANRVIQYSTDSTWFSFGLLSKTKKMGNGIIVENMPLSESKWDGKQPIEIISVALIAYWHGYDRLIRAMHELEKIKPNMFTLTIVGDGEELEALKKLVLELKLSNIRFTGMLDHNGLNKEFSKAHIGVSSLGLHRKGLYEAADLKTREYAARGLMILGAGEDIDFSDEIEFRLKVPCDETIEPIIDALQGITLDTIVSKEKVRTFALERLSMEVKVKEMLLRLS